MVVDRPGTTEELAQRFGMRADRMRLVLNTMRNHGLVYETALRGTQPVWSNHGPPLPRRPRQGNSAFKVGTVSLFCRVALTLIEQASSRDEIVEWGGITRQSLRDVLNTMLALRLAFVEDWRKRIPSGGPPVPLFRFGIDRPSKRRPAAEPSSVIHHRKRELRKRRIAAADLTFLTAGRVRPAPTKANERTA